MTPSTRGPSGDRESVGFRGVGGFRARVSGLEVWGLEGLGFGGLGFRGFRV